jgi:hypothetical protein
MGVQENEDESVNLLEVQHQVAAEEELIEQVFSQEAEDISTVEPSIESEDQERFEETAKFEEVDTQKPKQKQGRKSKVTRKNLTRGVNKDKPISKLHDELRKHSDARKKAEREILDIRKELKDLLLTHHATIKNLQKQVAQMHRKIATIDSSRKSTRGKTTTKKKVSGKKTTRNMKTISKKSKKSGQKKSRKR